MTMDTINITKAEYEQLLVDSAILRQIEGYTEHCNSTETLADSVRNVVNNLKSLRSKK